MAKNMTAIKRNATIVTYIDINGEHTVTVDGQLNGGRATAAAKRATGNKNILFKGVEHVAETYDVDIERGIELGVIVKRDA